MKIGFPIIAPGFLLFLLEVAMILSATFLSATDIPSDCLALIEDGEYTKAQAMLRQHAADPEQTESQKRALLFEIERLDRIRIDFSLTPEEMLSQLREEISKVTFADMARWRKEGVLEGRTIDGKLYFFNRARNNLFRMSPEAEGRRIIKPEPARPYSDREISIEEHMKRILEARKSSETRYVIPQKYRIQYRLSVKPGIVPAGEIIRCWLLYPRERANQKNILMIATSPEQYQIAPNEANQRTVYFEQPASATGPTEFRIEYEVTTYAQCEPVDPAKVQSATVDSEIYREFTAERPPHLEFTPLLKKLASEIVGDQTNPYLKAKKIFAWIDQNIKYTSALEYSTIPNIGQYCAENRRGDCGIQGLLFIALCRISGVPAKWQSGWSLLPGKPGMHDWTEFYVEPYGWLPADPSRGLRPVDNPEIKWFNFGNMDQFRLIGNDDYGAELVPPKKHFRSEPVDFQRGEVEWEGGNLYFPQWEYEIQVEHL